jgi:hypothetical protein
VSGTVKDPLRLSGVHSRVKWVSLAGRPSPAGRLAPTGSSESSQRWSLPCPPTPHRSIGKLKVIFKKSLYVHRHVNNAVVANGGLMSGTMIF